MRIFLTGASGFVGSYTLTRLLSAGHHVAVLLRDPAKAWRITDQLDHATVVQGDLSDLGAIEARLKSFEPEAVAHLAWFGVGGKDRNDPRQADNITQTVRLVELAAGSGAKHFVGLGSQAEYGPRQNVIDESAPIDPTTMYGIAKASSMMLARKLCEERGLRFAWLRLFSSYGAKDESYWMIPYLILKLLKGERPSLTEGEQLWDYVHVSDVADAIARVIEMPTAVGLFNLGSGSVATLRSTIQTIRDAVDPSLSLGFGDVPYRPDQVMHLQADVSRLRQQTGWQPRTPLDEGLAATVAWYRENAGRYDR